jgi:hypothetical protein
MLTKSLFQITLITSLFFILFSCSKDGDLVPSQTDVEVKVFSVEITPKTYTFIDLESTYTFSAIVKDQNGNELENRVVVWSSSDEEIVEINNAGLATANNFGTAIIKGFVDGVEATVSVKVEKQPNNIVLSHENFEFIAFEESVEFSAEVQSPDGTLAPIQTVNWESSNPEIVTIDEKGKATSKKNGEAIITVRDTEGTSATISVNVNQKVAKLNPANEEVSIEESKSVYLHITALDANNYVIVNPELDWSSSNENVAKVENDGVVTGISKGSTVVRARAGEVVAPIIVKVIEPVNLTGKWKGQAVVGNEIVSIDFTLDDDNGSVSSTNPMHNKIGVFSGGFLMSHFGINITGTVDGSQVNLSKSGTFHFSGTVVNENKINGKFSTFVPLGINGSIFTNVAITLERQ